MLKPYLMFHQENELPNDSRKSLIFANLGKWPIEWTKYAQASEICAKGIFESFP